MNSTELSKIMSTLNKNLILSGIILASAASSSIVQAAPFVEARSLGMGNVSIATADIATAALANPAMLSYQEESDDFSLLLGGGVFLDDSAGMIDLIDEFQAASSQVTVSGSEVVSANTMKATANALNGNSLAPTGVFSAVVGFSFEEYSLAFSARNEVVAAVGIVNGGVTSPDAVVLGDELAIVAEFTGGNNQVAFGGATILELGLSGAKSFEFMGQKVSVGVTPKIVSAESFFTAPVDLATFDTDTSNLIDTNNSVSLDSTVTVDVGIVSQISESTQVGLVIKNLIEDTLVNGTESVNIGRQMKVGVAYRDDTFTLGADLDLMEIDPVITSLNFQSKATQMASVGLEIDVWDVVQLRVGMQKNLADNPSVASEDALLTAGVGLSLGVNVDIAVAASGDTFGAFVQTGFKF